MREQNVQAEVRKSVRERKVSSKLKGFEYKLPRGSSANNINSSPTLIDHLLSYMEYYTPEYIISLNNAMKVKEPVSYKHASKEVGWTSAMVEELEALKKNETWEWADLPPDKKALDSKWVYKVKHTREGDVERLKARLVVRETSKRKENTTSVLSHQWPNLPL